MIVNWNRRDYIKATLQHLRDHWYRGMEVLVVDNASTDGTPEMIASEFPEMRLMSLPENVGQCKGLNIGLENSRAEVVISLDNDAILQPGSIERILAKFSERPRLAVLHGKIIDYDNREHVWWWEWYGFKKSEYEEREFATPWKIAEGLCALRRDAVLEVGGFPEEYFIMEAGRDLAIKLVEAGYELTYVPGVAFEHKSSAEREKTDRYRLHSDRRMYYKLRNELWTLWKYYPIHHVIAKTGMKMAMWAYVMTKQGSLPTYARAIVDAYKGLPMIMEKRRPVSKRTLRTIEYSRVQALKQLRGVMSWYYVVKGKTRGAAQK
jgi:GT2 family glycosyltransferase